MDSAKVVVRHVQRDGVGRIVVTKGPVPIYPEPCRAHP